MCKLCDEGIPQDHTGSVRDSRRDFLKAAATTGVAAAGLNLFAARPAAAKDKENDDPPDDTGKPGRRYIIRGGSVMSMDPNVGDFPKADIMIEGKKIVAVGANLPVAGATQISHSPTHSDAAIQALLDTGRRAAFGYFESAGNFGAGVPGNQYPQDADRIYNTWFSPNNLSSNGLVHMIMGGEVYLNDASTDNSWKIGRRLGLQIAAHILSPFGIRPIFDALAAGTGGN